MRTVGAILAGGQSRRFGSDKALARWRGARLIDHAIAVVRPHVEAIVICGRDWPDLPGIADRPQPGLGPLGGLNAALAYGLANGFDRVLSVPCDLPILDPELLPLLLGGEGPAYLGALPVVGVWPTALAGSLDAFLAVDRKRAVRGWADSVGARRLDVEANRLANINYPADLAALATDERGQAT